MGYECCGHNDESPSVSWFIDMFNVLDLLRKWILLRIFPLTKVVLLELPGSHQGGNPDCADG